MGSDDREGNATPAWLANDFNASRRHALIVAQIIKLGQKLTDDAVSIFIKLMGRLFSQANNARSNGTWTAGRITEIPVRLSLPLRGISATSRRFERLLTNLRRPLSVRSQTHLAKKERIRSQRTTEPQNL